MECEVPQQEAMLGAGTQTDTKLPQSVGTLPQHPNAAPVAGAARPVEVAYTPGPFAQAIQATRDHEGDFPNSRHAGSCKRWGCTLCADAWCRCIDVTALCGQLQGLLTTLIKAESVSADVQSERRIRLSSYCSNAIRTCIFH